MEGISDEHSDMHHFVHRMQLKFIDRDVAHLSLSWLGCYSVGYSHAVSLSLCRCLSLFVIACFWQSHPFPLFSQGKKWDLFELHFLCFPTAWPFRSLSLSAHLQLLSSFTQLLDKLIPCLICISTALTDATLQHFLQDFPLQSVCESPLIWLCHLIVLVYSGYPYNN